MKERLNNNSKNEDYFFNINFLQDQFSFFELMLSL